MRIKFLCIIICLFVNALVFASATNHTITGVVISGEDNEPLIGASVYVHADDLKKAGVSQTSLGTITDMDGNFKIQAAKGDVLEVSYIGYASQAITLTNAQPLKITMGEDTQKLDEVVVTALGTVSYTHLRAHET